MQHKAKVAINKTPCRKLKMLMLRTYFVKFITCVGTIIFVNGSYNANISFDINLTRTTRLASRHTMGGPIYTWSLKNADTGTRNMTYQHTIGGGGGGIGESVNSISIRQVTKSTWLIKELC
jgi:hypothetical protein